MQLTIPELSLVVLIGASGSGKSSFAARHFLPTEILSSDHCRGLVADDENDQAATPAAFEVLHFIAAKRLAAGRLTVVDATNVQKEARQSLLKLAREYHVIPVAIVLNLPERLCHERNATRPDRQFGAHVVRNQCRDLRQSLRHLKRDGFRHIKILDDPETVAAVSVVREPLWTNRRELRGPFDIIGDIHGCAAELDALLGELGYTIDSAKVSPPPGRQAVFLGDLVDRGPDSPGVLRRVMAMVADGAALCVPGNHDIKLLRKLNGKNPQLSHGLAETVAWFQDSANRAAYKHDIYNL